MDLNARVDVNCERTDVLTDGRKTGRLYRTLLKQVRQKDITIAVVFSLGSLMTVLFIRFTMRVCQFMYIHF